MGTFNPVARDGVHQLARLRLAEVGLQFHDVLREGVGPRRCRPPQRARRHRVGAGRAAEAEVDASRVKRLERAELFGDDQRRMIGQHDAAGAHANPRRAAGHVTDHHGGGGTGDARHVVMLGEPEAVIPEPFGVSREVERVAERCGGVAAEDDRGEIEDREGNHRRRRSHQSKSALTRGVRRVRLYRSPHVRMASAYVG